MSLVTAKIAAIALATLSSQAFAANNTVIAKYSLTVLSTESNSDQYALADLALQSDGDLVIDATFYNRASPGQPVTQRQSTTHLNSATFTVLKNKITELSTAEIATTHTQIVCMMLPAFGSSRVLEVRRDYDWQSDSFKGNLQVVDNNAGCWQSTHIQPKEEYAADTARQLESAMEVLATEAVGN